MDKEHVLDFCGTTNPLALKLKGGSVRRYHTEGEWIQQSVAQHTWRMMVILLYLWPRMPREAILFALYHDAAEVYTGGVPATVKRLQSIAIAYHQLEQQIEGFLGIPGKETLLPADYARVKVADYLELCITCSQHPTVPAADRIFNKGRELIGEYARQLSADEQTRITSLLYDIREGEYNV